MGCSTSIACYPAKIPHFLESLKILAFYAILPSTPLIACESFIQALLSGFERVVCRLARPSNRWLKRPTPNASRRFPLFKSSTAARSCSYGLFPWAALLRFAFGQKIWHTIFFSPQANFKIFPKLLLRRGASQFPKSWRVTVHPRYRGHSSVCKKLYAKGQSRLEAVGSEVDAACDFGGLRRVANDNLRSG